MKSSESKIAIMTELEVSKPKRAAATATKDNQ